MGKSWFHCLRRKWQKTCSGLRWSFIDDNYRFDSFNILIVIPQVNWYTGAAIHQCEGKDFNVSCFYVDDVSEHKFVWSSFFNETLLPASLEGASDVITFQKLPLKLLIFFFFSVTKPHCKSPKKRTKSIAFPSYKSVVPVKSEAGRSKQRVGYLWSSYWQWKGKTTNLPVSMSVTAKLNIRTLYGLASIDLLLKITTHIRRLPTKDNNAMNAHTAAISELCSSGDIPFICLLFNSSEFASLRKNEKLKLRFIICVVFRKSFPLNHTKLSD